MIRKSLAVSMLVVSAVIPVPGASAAPPADLAALFPPDTLVYVARGGSDQTEAAFKSSAFGKTWNDPQVARFVDQAGAAIDKLIVKELRSKRDRATYSAARRVAATMFRRPAALAITEFQTEARKPPVIGAALVCQVGADSASFMTDVQTLLTGLGIARKEKDAAPEGGMRPLGLPVPGGAAFGVIDGHFILAVGQDTVDGIRQRLSGGGESLASAATLTLPRRKIGGDASTRVMTFYLNAPRVFERLLALTPAIAEGTADAEQMSETVGEVLKQLGADQMKSIVWEMHYRDGGCLGATYTYTGGKARGLFAPGGPALRDADLAVLPRGATWATIWRADFAGLYRAALAVLERIDADAHRSLGEAVADLEQELGLKLESDIFVPMGDSLTVFDAPENGGIWFTGTTFAFRSADPGRLATSLRRLSEKLAELAGTKKTRVQSIRHGEYEIDYVNVVGVPMPVAPSWTVAGERVFVAFYPQVLMATIDRLSGGKPAVESVLAHPDYQRAMKTIGPVGTSFGFVDTRGGVEALYPLLQTGGQLLSALGQGEGLPLDPATVPSRRALTQHLFADVSTSRADEDGVLRLSFGPLPVAAPSLSMGGASSLALSTSILLPSLSRARELSKRTVCMSNLRGISSACYIYAQDHDKFPPDFQALIDANYVTAKQFVCPSSGAEPGDLSACYTYIPGQSPSSNPTNVLIYENLENHRGEGAAVLFVDAHVEFLKPDALERAIAETKERLAKTRSKPPRDDKSKSEKDD